jgi:hypothetical protein
VAAASVQADAGAVLAKVVKLMRPEDDARLAEAVETPADTALGGAAWWGTGPAATSQSQLHGALLRLAAAGPATHAVVSEAVGADIERAYAGNPTEFAYRAAAEHAGELHPDALESLGGKVAAAAVQAATLDHRAAARMALAKAAAAAGEDAHAAPFLIDADELISYLATPVHRALLAEWFALEPSSEEGAKVALALGPTPSAANRRVVAAWAAKRTRDQRTQLILQLAALANDTSEWVADLSADEVDEDLVVSSLEARLKAASRSTERDDLARTIAALRPRTPSGQQAVGQLALWLLGQGRRTYDETAIILFPALGTQHRAGTKLSDAVAAADARGTRFTYRALEDLRNANVRVRKASVGDDLWRRFRWGRRR